MNLAQLFSCVIKTQMYFKHHNKKSNLSTYYQTSLNLKILRISFCEILYYIASILSKINNVLFSWQVSLSPLSEFSGSVLVFRQHCGKYMLQILPLISALPKGEDGFSWGGGGGIRCQGPERKNIPFTGHPQFL